MSKQVAKSKQSKSKLERINRYDLFLKYLPECDYVVSTAAKKAGFADSTAEKQQRRLYDAALNYMAEKLKNLPAEKQESVLDKVGLSRQEVADVVKFWVTQERDGSSAYKFAKPFTEEIGVRYEGDDQNKTIVPVQINLGEKEQSTEPQSESDSE